MAPTCTFTSVSGAQWHYRYTTYLHGHRRKMGLRALGAFSLKRQLLIQVVRNSVLMSI
ncbi:hypothetical protein [Bartonella senegalensis]|uniref:hypothetical protein n=1 Tax=Bartonella senegalensis TaxID=1468418 RepID=UPI0018A8277F